MKINNVTIASNAIPHTIVGLLRVGNEEGDRSVKKFEEVESSEIVSIGVRFPKVVAVKHYTDRRTS